MKVKSIFVLLMLVSGSCFAAAPPCSSAAVAQAGKLLSYHTDGDDRAEVESRSRQLPSLTNPANKSQKFIVLEVMGSVYKGSYRMRFIYYPVGRECVLMGQEILELADL
jgi:hypothetical protein